MSPPYHIQSFTVPTSVTVRVPTRTKFFSRVSTVCFYLKLAWAPVWLMTWAWVKQFKRWHLSNIIRTSRKKKTRHTLLQSVPLRLLKTGDVEADRLPLTFHYMHRRSKRIKSTHLFETAKKAAICYVGPYLLVHMIFEEFEQIKWNTIVFDEAQNIQNPETKQSKAARSLSTNFKVALTGNTGRKLTR